MPSALELYAHRKAELFGHRVRSGEVLAKILTPNDDSGRHGVLIPNEAYSFFPPLLIVDPLQNSTARFVGFDVLDGAARNFAWKYYERYPERRITRLNPAINDVAHGRRLVIFLHLTLSDGTDAYYVDAAIEGRDAKFETLIGILFGHAVPQDLGAFVRLPLDIYAFEPDAALNDLLARFDEIDARGWIPSLRIGDTGIGYTFESLVGVGENNDKRADFHGIELKCKLLKPPGRATGKTNLFQQAPEWSEPLRAIDRLTQIGQIREDGSYACFSQVTLTPNNLGLALEIAAAESKLKIRKDARPIGFWSYEVLKRRLEEKHARTAFIKADTRGKGPDIEYRYCELVYCERPNIERFVELVLSRNIVFEFLMYERQNHTVRNRGYPWRLGDQGLLDQLFAMQIKLRG